MQASFGGSLFSAGAAHLERGARTSKIARAEYYDVAEGGALTTLAIQDPLQNLSTNQSTSSSGVLES